MMLTDYLGFNFLYRVYYKAWLKKVQKGIEQVIYNDEAGNYQIKKNPRILNEKNSLPHLEKNIPFAYTLFNWFWRYWDFWFRQWALPKGPAGKIFISCSIIFFIFSLLYSFSGRLKINFFRR